ncbi:tetratricopeptide repeat protein [Vibrio algivorus]|uniref:Sel1 repeat family protein n=1 Tax=Vibrio algivorus TaxID=1667024 RepID=A0A557P5C1_9VIBR|nr:sel1 repeat family protein [Vibrio algivorus]TVO35863.1 sel1 repeat family protein [Vibrio algivorus]
MKLTPKQAYDKGMLLRWQYKLTDAKAYLKYAADNGLSNAMYMYGVLSRSNIFIQTDEQYQYFKSAAELNNINGMLALTDNASIASKQEKDLYKATLTKYLLEKSKAGDGSSMYLLYILEQGKNGLGWLEKSAQSGYAKAQYYLAYNHDGGDGWFLIPGSREKEIRRLYKASADQGYIPAISQYGAILVEENNLVEALKYWNNAIDQGAALVILSMAEIYSGKNSQVHLEENKVLAATYYQVYFDSMGSEKNENLHRIFKEKNRVLLETMTNEQKAESDRLAKEYLKTHTVRAFDDFWYLSEEDSVIKP